MILFDGWFRRLWQDKLNWPTQARIHALLPTSYPKLAEIGRRPMPSRLELRKRIPLNYLLYI